MLPRVFRHRGDNVYFDHTKLFFMDLKTVGRLGIALFLTIGMSCRSQYQMTGIERSRVLVDRSFDTQYDASLERFIAPYRHEVDSIMSPVVGKAARYMSAQRPESILSNLLADILMWAAKDYHEQPDLAVYNVGGIRAAFAEGNVTYGDVLDVAPFENKICFLTLTGEKLLELFSQIASVGGEGVSHGVELVITKDNRLSGVCLNGHDINPSANYRIATLDYLAQGNDKMYAFKDKTQVNAPQDASNNVRFIIMNYFREKMEQGEAVDSRMESRIIVE